MHVRLGDELPLWEAEYDISPWGPERDDLNAWKVACEMRLARGQKPPPFSWFDRTREARTAQPIEEAKRNLELAAATWPKPKAA